MKQYLINVFCFCMIALFSVGASAQITEPSGFFGFTPGNDRKMFSYEKMIEYLQLLEKQSPRIYLRQFGTTELGKPMYIVFISSEENISNLDRLREINRQLALDEIHEGTTRQDLIEEGKVFYLSALSMHATEVGPVQAFPAIAWNLVSGEDARYELIRKNTVAMFIPHNPDGMNMVEEYYNKHVGTRWENSTFPGVYHKYIGHNINRDFVTLSQKENQMVAGVYSTEWFPQVLIERHQMGSNGPRFFISPPHDPISENVDAGIYNWSRVFGSRALQDMTAKGLEGVSVNYLFDDYWPGATTTSNWKGVISMLSEAASVNLATPVYVEANEIRPSGKGLSENSISINLPRPWQGGWWHLSDIVKYEWENTFSNLYTSALHKEEILQFRNEVSRREIKRGMEQAPYFYILPARQNDQSEWTGIVNLLHRHGVKVYALSEDIIINNRQFRKDDIVVPLSQPYRAFIKEVLEKQRYPERYYSPGGELMRPYDITSWSLPLHRGVEAIEINNDHNEIAARLIPIEFPFTHKHNNNENKAWALFSSGNNESYKAAFMAMAAGVIVERTIEPVSLEGQNYPAGSFIIPAGTQLAPVEAQLSVSPLYLAMKPAVAMRQVKMPRIAIVETWFHDMDAGWMRFIFDQYKVPYSVLRPADLQNAKLQRDYDMLFFTDRAKSIYMNGKYDDEGEMIPLAYMPEYSKGMESKGFQNLLQFVQNGGKIMSWGPSVELFEGPLSLGEGDAKEDFILPFSDISKSLAEKGLDIPGSLMKVRLNINHPLTWGMPSEFGVFHRGRPVFRTSQPQLDSDRRVLASFSDTNLLMSGYAENEELLRKEAALIWIRKGKGQLILSSFNPQFRASTTVTFKLIFNAILLE